MNLDSRIPSGPIQEKWDRARFEMKLVNPANKRKYTIIMVGTGLAGGAAAATLGELGEVVKREFGVSPEAFVAAATAARFGPVEGARAAAITARRELRALLELARRALTWRDRARGLLSLRSLARPAAVDASAPSGSG